MRGVTANGSEIFNIRSTRGFTQDQLAARAELDVKTIRKAEKSQRIDLATLTRLAFSLETDLSRLIVAGTAAPEDRLSHRDVILQWHRAFEAQDMEGILAVYTNDAVLNLPGGPTVPFGGTFRGRDELPRAYEAVWQMPHEPITVDEFVILLSSDAVTLTGAKALRMPSGEVVRFPTLQIFRFRDDRIATHDVQFDTLDFAQRMRLPR